MTLTNTTTDSWAGPTRPDDQPPGSAPGWGLRPPDDGRSGGRSAVVGLGIAFSLLLIVWGVLWVVMLLIRQDETTAVSVDQPFSSAVVYTDSGDVRVVGGDGTGSVINQRMRWSFSKPRVTTEVRDDVLYITGNCLGIELGLGCQLNLLVAVPAGTSLEVVSGSGDINVRGLSDSVAVRTGSGDVDVRVPRGAAAYDVNVDTGSGDQDVDVASDPGSSRSIAARTGSGDVTIT